MILPRDLARRDRRWFVYAASLSVNSEGLLLAQVVPVNTEELLLAKWCL
jgi:hypothetical protein